MTALKSLRIAVFLFIAMCGLSVAAVTLRPDKTVLKAGEEKWLDGAVPKAFGRWTEVPISAAQVVAPDTKELLDRIYTDILSRVYVNDQGYRVMLSIAYGSDQRGGLQAHKPEICYPAQGFKSEGEGDGLLTTSYGAIETRQLRMSMGTRAEPVTYWITNGDRVVRNQMDRRIEQLRKAITGQIPDGVVFRVSSIDANAPRAFAQQGAFVSDLLAAVSPESRKRLSGLQVAAAPAQL